MVSGVEIEGRPDLNKIFQSLSVGIAVIDPSTWTVLHENARFFQLFPPTGDPDDPFTERVPDLKAERAASRLAEGRKHGFEVETKTGDRAVPIRIEMRPVADSDPPIVLVECVDASKEKEAQYMLDSYSKMSERHRAELEKEKQRVERLLLNLMPKAVYDELKEYGTTTPHKFDCVSILMLDFARFTSMAISHDASALVAELNDIFTAFDRIVENFGCERIRTIGDSYMAVAGVPVAADDHVHSIAKVALRMRRYIERRNAAHPVEWRCRIGIHAGPVIGSLVGVQKYVYDLFGPGVNMAARMESLSEPMKITLSEDTYEMIKDDFMFTEREEVDVKGFGKHLLYYLDGDL